MTDAPDQVTWVRVLGPRDLGENGCRSVRVGSVMLCVSRVGGRYGAIDDVCPHRGAPLGSGFVEGGRVLCPLHGWDFDPFDGTHRGGFSSGVRGYRTEVREDGVYVALPLKG
jgi:pyruvate oxidase